MTDTVSQKLLLEVETSTKKANSDLRKLKKLLKETGDTAGKQGDMGKGIEQTSGVLSRLNNMSTKSVFAISNLAQTFSLASGPAHQMKYVMGQVMDQFALMGPKGLLIGGAVAGLGMLWKEITKAGDSAKVTGEDLRKFAKNAATQMQNMKSQIAKLEISAMFEDMADGPRKVFEETKATTEMLIMMSEGYIKRYQEKQKRLADTIEDLKRAQEGVMVDRQQLGERGLRQARLEQIQEEEMGTQRVDRIGLEKQITKLIAEKNLHVEQSAASLAKNTESLHTNKMLLNELKDSMPEVIAAQKRFTASIEGTTKAAKEKNKATKEDKKTEEEETKPKRIVLDEMVVEAETQQTKIAKEESEKRNAIAKKEADLKGALVQEGFNLSTSLLAESIQITLSGEKNMGEALLKMFLERTGQSLIAIGTRAVFEGAVMNSTLPGSGVAAMATGAAAIAAGAAMTAGAAAINVGGTAGAGGAGSGEAEAGGSGGGVSSGGFGGTNQQQGTGTTIINISYGVGGPNPEDAAQAVLDAIALGGRRGLEGRA